MKNLNISEKTVKKGKLNFGDERNVRKSGKILFFLSPTVDKIHNGGWGWDA